MGRSALNIKFARFDRALLVVLNQCRQYLKFILHILNGRLTRIYVQQFVKPQVGLCQLGIGKDGLNGGIGLEG